MEPSFRPRTDSARPPLSALLSARDLARFALTQVCVLISGNVSVTPSGPVETLSAWSREARLHRPKGQAGSARSFRNPTRVHAAPERLLDRTCKRQLVAIWIRQMEIAFAPGCVLRLLRMQSLCLQV